MFWIPLLVIIGALVIIAIVLLRKIPQLRVINVESIAKVRGKKLKEQIILQKLERKGRKRVEGIAKSSTSAFTAASKVGRRAVQRLYKMEQYYQKLRRTASEGEHAYDSETIKRIISEAEKLIKEEEFIPAEKKYIDIISHNPKNIDAYEGLGNLYLKSGQSDQARETLGFAHRLSPNDASVCVSLAEIEMQNENFSSAVSYLKKAIEKRSKNPRYLDFYIEASLRSGSLKDVRKGISRLKEVNPKNEKITDFENRFSELKKEYVEKTSTKDVNVDEKASQDE